MVHVGGVRLGKFPGVGNEEIVELPQAFDGPTA